MNTRINNALQSADTNTAPLNDCQPDGMTGNKIRRFLNSLCKMPDCRYLEVGLLKGATFTSALFGNSIDATGFDNWSQWDDQKTNRNEFYKALDRFRGKNNVKVIESDFFNYPLDQLNKKWNVFFYDGDHTPEMQRDAIIKTLPFLDDPFVLLVDDWGWEWVRRGTEEGILATKLQLVKEWVREGSAEADGWWRGFVVKLLKKL